MENKANLKAQFIKYLNGKSSASEAERLLRHIQSGKDKDFLESLIADNLDNPIAEELAASMEVHSRLEQTHELLQQRIHRSKVIRMRTYRLTAVAAVLALFLGSALFLRIQIYDWVHPVHLQLLTTQKGERKQLTLADGTIIWLGPGSSLQYPEQFSRETREVKLVGAAFFEVAKDKKHPFIVHADHIDTRVLGTSFHIQAYKEDQSVQVILFTGKVALTAGKEHNQLLPGQEGLFDKRQQTITRKAYPDTAKYLAQRSGDFEYNGEPVGQVLADMQREFDVTIQPQGDVLGQSFYGNFTVKDGIQNALNKLCATIGATYEIRDSAYVIRLARK